MIQRNKSILFASVAVLFWSTVATAFKLTLRGMSFSQLLFYASLTSSVILFILLLKNKTDLKILLFNKKNFYRNVTLGFINPFLYYLVLFKAYSLLPAQEAQPLNYTWPIVVSLFSAIFLGDKLTLKIIVGLILAFFGVLVISTRGNLISLKFHSLIGVILAVGSSVIWAIYWTMGLKDKRTSLEKLGAGFFFGTIFSAIYLLFFGSFVIQNKMALFGSIYTGCFEMGFTFILWMRGMELSNNKGKTATLAYFSPFLSVIFIAFILKEKILFSSITGLIFIVAGIFIQSIKIKK